MNNEQVNKLMAAGVPEGQMKPAQVAGWLQEVETAKGRERNWRTEAPKIVALYEGYKPDYSPFNILYSNTDTLLPALYNNTPRPNVGRRFKDKDPLGAAVANTMNRTLAFLMDTNSGDEPEFDQLVEHALLGALVPGRGLVRYKYVADYKEPGGVAATLEQPVNDIPNTPAEGEAAQEPIAEVTNERVCGEPVAYDRFTCGYAATWEQVPWIAFEHHMTQDEVETNFGAELAAAVKYGEIENCDAEGGNTQTKDKRKVAVVQEIWNRADKTVIFLCDGMKDRELRLVEDPLGISGFFPMERPLKFLGKLSNMVPQPIYELYRKQAEELNLITNRITVILEALKVRGAYSGEVTEIKNILNLGDGEMVAVENIMSLGDGKTLKDAIFLMPLAELVSVLQQLYMQRGQIKTVIYEITGISDILRGSSVASETATAQNIKNQWGTLRLKKMQKLVQKWCRNNLRIMGEIAAKKFSPETFASMTGLPYITAEQKGQAELQMKQFQEQQAMAAQQPPQPSVPGQPPAPPPPPAQPPQQVVDALATPVWEDIVALMREEIGLQIRVDIETNSTIADDMAEDQKNVGELLNALSQFLNGVAPLIENGSMPFEVAKSIMLGIVRKMVMGPEIEDQLDKMQPPKPPEAAAPPPPPPVDPNIELKQQSEAAKIQGDMQRMDMEMKLAQQEMELKRMDLELKQEEMQMKRQQLQFQSQIAEEKFNLQMRQMAAKAAMPTQSTTPAGE